jgi:hypothetical protein
MLVNDRFRPIADISEHRLLNGMPQIGPDNWLEAERLDRRALRARLVGMYAAGPWTTLPAIASLPIMAVAGEGDYIIIVMGVLWAALLIGAIRVRRSAEVGSTRRSCATWVSSYSALLSLMMFGIALAIASGGSWR